MASPPLAQLLNLQTPEQIEATIVAFLKNPGGGLPALPADSWDSNSTSTYFLKSESLVLSSLSQAQVSATMGGYFQLAADPSLQYTSGPLAGTSPWVDLAAEQFYNTFRIQASPAVGNVVLTAAAGVGPINFTKFLTITDGNGNYYDYAGGGTVPLASTATFSFTAQTPGAASNIQSGTPVTLVTALPGVTAALASPSWITTAGTNLESDASLIARCLNLWTSLGTGSPQGAWINWCFAGSPEVRFATTNATGLGGVNVIVYGNNTAVSNAGLSLIEGYLRPRIPQCVYLAPGLPYAPGTPPYNVQNAQSIPLTMTAQIYGPASAQTSGLAAATAALRLLVQGTPIGGFAIAPGAPDTYGISNSDLVTAVTNSSSPITKAVVSVNNGSGLVANADFLMPPSAGVPTVAQSPTGANPFGLSWVST